MPLTVKQQLVLSYIRSHCATRGYPPTAREISAHCGLGGATSAHRIIVALQDAGYVEAWPGRSRAIRVVRQPVTPVAGVHAGVLRGAAAVHGRIRDHALIMAAQINLPSIKGELISDCACRHELVRRLWDATFDGDASALACAGALEKLADTVPSTQAWDLFVIDFLVFNRVTADYARALAPRLPQTESCLLDIASVSQRALVRGQLWADQLPSASSGSLSRRAEAVRRLCLQVWVTASRYWPETAGTHASR